MNEVSRQGALIGSLLSRRALRRYGEPALIAGVISAFYLILQPDSADHAAQVFRSGLFEDEGLSAWNNLWFGGHHTPGYSVLFPLLGSAIGAREAGVLATVISAVLFSAIAYRRWGDRARLGVIWFAAGATINLFTGRLSFALGLTIALAVVLAAQTGRRPLALVLAVLVPLASPVAALFLACAAGAHAIAERSRLGLELGAATLGTAVLVTVAFPEGGDEPFVYSSFQPAILVALAVFLAIPRQERLLRCGVAAYGAALAAAFLIDTPMGGNATRMGALFLGPALAIGLWRRQRFALVLLAPFLLYWQFSPVVRDLERVRAQPSAEADYYAEVRDFLRGATAVEKYRVEVLPAVHHWESAYLPRGIYIARGWERQLDRKLNRLFYEDESGPLTAAAYRRWLDDLAVGFVAVPHSELDYAGEAEARLISEGLPYLREVFRSPDWTVYEVLDPAPLAVGAGDVRKLTADGFTVRADAPGSVLVRVRWTPYWGVLEGIGCVEESPGGFTRVRLENPGSIRVGIAFAPWRALGSGPNCGREPTRQKSGGWERAARHDSGVAE